MKRDDPEILKLYGLSIEEAALPEEALLSAGLNKMHKVLTFMRLPLDFDAYRAPDNFGPVEKKTPLWRRLCGLVPGSEENMSPEKREAAIEQLLGSFMKLLRFEMHDEKQKANRFHTVCWDPLTKICAHLGIARAELSRLSKEGSGLAAHEMVDVVRVKSVKQQMKEHARAFIEALNAGSTSKEKAPTTALGVYRILKAARSGPQFHRGQWALTFGFPNYARFYRACLIYYQLAPQQLELIAIEEVLAELRAETEGLGDGRGANGGGDRETGGRGESSAAPVELSAEERLKGVVWEHLKKRHVQFFAEMSTTAFAAAG